MSEKCPITGSRGILRMRHAMDQQLLDKRKPDPERRAAVITIFCPYPPMVRLDNGARDGQPHAHAFSLAGEERFEQGFLKTVSVCIRVARLEKAPEVPEEKEARIAGTRSNS
jgi:hypothetical protein